MNFAVVSFHEENDSLGIIPTNWITSSGHSCFYPTVISDLTRNNLILTRQEPKSNWKEFDIRILRQFENYDEAKCKLMDVEITSITGSEWETIRMSKRPRKKRKIILPGESSSSDDEVENKNKFVKTHNSKSPPKSLTDTTSAQATTTNTNSVIQTPTTPVNYTVQTGPNLTPCIVQLSPTLRNKTVKFPIILRNATVQTPFRLTNNTEQTLPKPPNHNSQTLLKLTNHNSQTPSILTNHTKQSSLTLANYRAQTPPTLTYHIAPTTPPTLTNNTEQTLNQSTNHNTQSQPILSNHTVQTPPILTNRNEQTTPTLTNHTAQNHPTLEPHLELSTNMTLPSIINIKSLATHDSKFEGVPTLVSPRTCGDISPPLSQPLHVDVNTESAEEAAPQSPSLSSPGSCSSSRSIKTEILTLRKNQEMMWTVLGEFSQKLDSILGALARIESKYEVNKVQPSCPDDIWPTVNFPLSQNDFPEFEERLLDLDFRRSVVKILSNLNGSTIKNLAAHIMRKLLCDELAEEYSLTGKFMTKKAFDQTRTFKLVCEVCFQKFSNGEETRVRESVTNWLMQAKFRRLRREKSRTVTNDQREDQLQTFSDTIL